MTELETICVFCLGGGAYGLLELAWRRRTHWTMVLAGGVCFLLMYRIAATDMGRPWQYLLCAAVITSVEFITGAVVNVALGWRVWDYSARPWNLYGQICARYTALWLLLSVPGCALARALRASVFHRGL